MSCFFSDGLEGYAGHRHAVKHLASYIFCDFYDGFNKVMQGTDVLEKTMVFHRHGEKARVSSTALRKPPHLESDLTALTLKVNHCCSLLLAIERRKSAPVPEPKRQKTTNSTIVLDTRELNNDIGVWI